MRKNSKAKKYVDEFTTVDEEEISHAVLKLLEVS